MDNLYRRFEAAMQRETRKRLRKGDCPVCGNRTYKFGCSVCDSHLPFDDAAECAVWREAVRVRKGDKVRHATARAFFNRLTHEAQVHLVRRARTEEIWAADNGLATPLTCEWLLQGIKPGKV